MLAVVLAWAMLAQILILTTSWNRWLILVIAAIPFIMWMRKYPEDF